MKQIRPLPVWNMLWWQGLHKEHPCLTRRSFVKYQSAVWNFLWKIPYRFSMCPDSDIVQQWRRYRFGYFRKLWCNYRSNFFGGVGITVVKPFLNGSGKGSNHIRVFRKEALFGTIGSIRHIAAFHAQRSHDKSGAFLFQKCCGRFKFHGIIGNAGRKCRGSWAEIYVLNNIDIFF